VTSVLGFFCVFLCVVYVMVFFECLRFSECFCWLSNRVQKKKIYFYLICICSMLACGGPTGLDFYLQRMMEGLKRCLLRQYLSECSMKQGMQKISVYGWENSALGLHGGVVLSTVAVQREGSRFNSWLGHFCVEFACSPHVRGGSLRVLRLPPTDEC